MRGAAWIAALFASFLSGCVFSPIAPASPYELGGCHPGAYALRSEITCERDSDCLLCGPGCGTIASRQSVALTGEACPATDIDACHGEHPACCGGRCVRSLGAPHF